MNIETVLWIIWSSLMGLMAIGAVLMSVFYHILRRRHREAWVQLGSPTLILNMSMANQRRVNRFLWGGAYRELGDPTLDRIALGAKILGCVSVVLFLAGVLIVLSRQR